MEAKGHAVGDAVLVLCHIIPKGGTRKVLRTWLGHHKVSDVLQEGRLYVVDTGQKVHFERLKKHVHASWDWAARQPFGLDQNVAIIADPYVRDSNEEITSDISRESFLPEQLPETSIEMEQTIVSQRGRIEHVRSQLGNREFRRDGSVKSDSSLSLSQIMK